MKRLIMFVMFLLTLAAPASAQWQTVPYAEWNFRTDASIWEPYWEVEPQDQIAYSYRRDGDTLTVAFQIDNTRLNPSAGAVTALKLMLPEGVFVSHPTITPIRVANRTWRFGVAVAYRWENCLYLYVDATGTAAWDPAYPISVQGTLTLPVE